MSTAPDPKPPKLTLETLDRIDEICMRSEEDLDQIEAEAARSESKCILKPLYCHQ